MKYMPKTPAEALGIDFKDIFYRDVAKYLSKTRGIKISHTTVRNWHVKFMKIISDEIEKGGKI
ncbi:MAG: hypothetical protein ACREAK_01205 [Nitrosarchaeum sp.]